MQRALEDPQTDISAHALNAAAMLGGDEREPKLNLRFNDDEPMQYRPSQNITDKEITDKERNVTGVSFSFYQGEMILKFRNTADATVLYQNQDTQEEEEFPLTPEQQEIADQYSAEAAFSITGMLNGELGETDAFELGSVSDGDEEAKEEVKHLIERALTIMHGLRERTGKRHESTENRITRHAFTAAHEMQHFTEVFSEE